MALSAPTLAQADPLTQRLFSRRDLIPPLTDILWRIDRGAVRTVTWSEDGTLRALGYWGPGELVGHPLSRIKPYQIECSTSVEMSILPSELWSQALDAMFNHVQQIEELRGIVHRNPASLRLWQFLVWLGQKFGRDIDQGRLIDLPLTHQEMAEALNMTRVTVTRLLQQFSSEGKLLRLERRLIICGQRV